MNRHGRIPLLFFLLLPSLAVRLKFVIVATEAAAWWPELYAGDTRSWWKAVLLSGTALWMLGVAAAAAARGWRPRHRRFSLLVAFAALGVVASALASDWPVTAWMGYTAQYEGAAALLSYLVGIWYAAEAIRSREDALPLLRAAGAVALLNAGLGIAKHYGFAFWESAAGRWVMGAGDAPVRYTFPGAGMPGGTVFQPNHYGMFMAMLAMLSLGMIGREEKRGWRLFWAVTAVSSLAGVVFSQSRTAVAVTGLLVAGWLCLSAPALFRRARTASPGALLLTGGVALAAVLGLWSGAVETVRRVREREATLLAADDAQYRIKAITLADNTLRFVAGDETIRLEKDAGGGWLAFSETGGATSPIPIRWTDVPGGREASFPGREDCVLRVWPDGYADARFYDGGLALFSTGGKIYAVDYKERLQSTLTVPDAASLFGLERYAGTRGYIWTRGLALVPAAPWLGSGPGTFALRFPNADLLGKERYFEPSDEDKGHGVWVTFPVQIGLLGTAGFAAVAVYALLSGWRRRPPFFAPAFAGALAYICCLATNDSTVGTTPAFCLLLGLLASAAPDSPTENATGSSGPPR